MSDLTKKAPQQEVTAAGLSSLSTNRDDFAACNNLIGGEGELQNG